MKWPFSRRRSPAAATLPPQDGYALWASSYPPSSHNRLMETEQAVVASLLPELAGRAALDAGCGTGRYLQLLESRGATATGLDLSAPMLAQARFKNARLVRARIEALPFGARSFDVVVSGLALGDVSGLAPAVAELSRVLRPGGRLIYSVVHPSGAAKGWARTFEVSGRLCAIDGYWHAPAEHRSACAAAGLAIRSWVEPHLDGSADPVALVVEATR